MKNMHKYSTTSKAGHFCPLGTSLWWDSHETGMSTMCVLRYSGPLATLLASIPLCNRFKIPLSAFLCGLFSPHAPPLTHLPYLMHFWQGCRPLEKISKMAGNIFVIFIAPIEYTVTLCSHWFRRISGHGLICIP